MSSVYQYAARDLAHRWFAFFEGEVENLDEHLELFSDDVRLVHAGTTLLAESKDGMKAWFQRLPPENGSHFIERFEFKMVSDRLAVVTMKVAYQALLEDGRLIGAMIDYYTEVVFDEGGRACFRFIQKTPVMANPATTFTASFAANRRESFNACFMGRLLACDHAALHALTDDQSVADKLNAVLGHLSSRQMAEAEVLPGQGELVRLIVPDDASEWCLTLAEKGGAYLRITDLHPA